jgi:hypothetical protein
MISVSIFTPSVKSFENISKFIRGEKSVLLKSKGKISFFSIVKTFIANLFMISNLGISFKAIGNEILSNFKTLLK